MKFGRNDPCFCGSGLKYKKCCINKEESVNNMTHERVVDPKELEMIRAEIEKKMGPEPHLNMVPSQVWKGYRWRFIWNRVHWRPVNETFHEFILNIMKQVFGEDWRMKQMSLPEEERHILIKWVDSYKNWRIDNEENRKKFSTKKDDEHTWSAIPSGDVQALMQFSYDTYCLQIIKKLPDFLIKKLMNRNEFQGARYEVAVAAMIARAGFEIEFLDDQCGQEKHCEFIATQKSTKIKYGVEAKSRRRSGVIHQAGEFDYDEDYKGDVKNLLKKAITQQPKDLPYLIFIDLNLPPQPKVLLQNKKWFPDIKKIFDDRGTPTEENPDPFNAVFITNFAYYYAGQDEIAPAGEHLSIVSMRPKNKVYRNYPVQDIQPIQDIGSSIDKYAQIPQEV